MKSHLRCSSVSTTQFLQKRAVICLLSVAALCVFLFPEILAADSISFDKGFRELGSYATDGLLTWDNSWTFNGDPTTATNYPSNYDLELSSLITLFTPLAHSNILYLDVSDVVSTHFVSAWGQTFTGLTLTGITLESDFFAGHPFTYSGDYAARGEHLIGTSSGLCANSTNSPLITTPGWTASTQSSGISIHTLGAATDGLTGPWGCVYGDFRIQGGAVFALDFQEPINLKRLDPETLGISAIYGVNRQSIAGVLQGKSTPTDPAPEPSSLVLCGIGFIAAGIYFAPRRQHREHAR